MKNKLSPIILFVYNRPWHTQQTVEALQKNKLAKESELFIYSDATKNEDARKSVDEVREYIDKIEGFKKVTIIKREKNWGLANSIIDGVTKIVNEYGKIIVLEDDLVTSPYFLKFMNEALEFYENEEKVWHVSGWNYPIETEGQDNVFLWRVMNCWGWATWADKWQYYEKDVDKTIEEFSKEDIKKFNIDSVENFWGQVLGNKKKSINTWAIFWYAIIFKQNGLCLNSSQSFVENIGRDGSGENCNDTNMFSSKRGKHTSYKFGTRIKENKYFLKKIKGYYKMNKKTKFEKFIAMMTTIYNKEQFNPTFFGILLNPFYFSRKGLSSSIIELIPNLKGEILDIGCGSRPYEIFCVGNRYIGLELDNPENRLNKSADYYYDGEKIPFDTGSIDSVLTSQVFEHVFKPDRFLKEINRVLKAEGVLLLSVPLVWDEHEQPYDYARYTSFGLKYILKENGFEVISLKKTANDFTAIVQITTSFIHKKIFGKNKYINLLITIILIAPIHIIGLIISKLLPNNDDFYLDNVVLARKIRDAY